MFLLVEFLYYAVGIGLTNDAYQYVWFCTDTTLAMSFWQSQCRIDDISLDEDEDILQKLLPLVPHGGSCVFYLLCLIALLVALVPIRLNPWGC